MILNTAVKYFHSGQDWSHNGVLDKEHLPHFITSNLEHDAVKLVLEHFAEEGIASTIILFSVILHCCLKGYGFSNFKQCIHTIYSLSYPN